MQKNHSATDEAGIALANLKAAYEAAPIFIAVVDPASQAILWMNPAATKKLQYPGHLPAQLSLYDLFLESHRGQVSAVLGELTCDVLQTRSLQLALLSSDKKECRVDVRFGTVGQVGAEQRPTAQNWLVMFAADLSEQANLREELNSVRLFLESAPDATVVVDESGTILSANAQVKNLLGYQRTELLGKTVEHLIPSRFKPNHIAHRTGYTKAPVTRGMGTRGDDAALNLYALTKQGDEIPIEVSLNPIVTEGRTLVAAALRDMTDAREAEQALRRARDEAEAATAGKSRFLAAASHDLRQPLQAVRLYLSVLQRRMEDNKEQDVVGKMAASIDTMSDLLDTLLDISRLSSGAIEPVLSDFASLSLFENILASNDQQASQKGLSMTCDTSDFQIRSDPGLLARIIDNFVTNAIRYTDQGNVTLSAQRTEAGIRLSVIDSGIGIAETQLSKVFDEYFQVDNSSRNRKKGLGLGLSIVRHIAALLGHKIDVVSVEGCGSTFSVTVPEAASKAGQTREAARATPSTEQISLQVLFVDDDPAIADATSMFLATASMDVSVAGSGEEAIAKLDRGPPPDLVVSDYRLPNASGTEVIRHARRLYGADLPAILISGDTTISELSEDELDNCIFLQKPVESQALLELIIELTQKPL